MIDLTENNYLMSRTFCIFNHKDKYLLCRKKQDNEPVLMKRMFTDSNSQSWIYLFSSPDKRILEECVERYYVIANHYTAIDKIRKDERMDADEKKMFTS